MSALFDENLAAQAVAVVGMSGRFPGADGTEAFWRNLRAGTESITRFAPEELERDGMDPALTRDPRFVAARGVVQDPDAFDAAFFGYTPREAEFTDPQQRLFLECCWEALEHAGHDPARLAGRAGVFGGAGAGSYLTANLMSNPEVIDSAGAFQVRLGNGGDFLATRVSYKLGLQGPSLDVQTACSTSLVAVHLACQSLLSGECDLALAGGVTVLFPQRTGFVHQPGSILSPDGRCRPFDARAAGTVGGGGAGVVVLKRLEDARADGDTVHAIILGSAINNDGGAKVGFTAPSVDGQAKVIAEALAVAGVSPETVSYVEGHGSGTELGDPVEVAALTRAFRARTDERGFCALGSLKSNVGHLDAAAGVAGLIKTVMALRARELPPTLHFQSPNPALGLPESPFYVSAELRPWEPRRGVRRAGVSSFGVGGTNAHVVLEEAPDPGPSGPAREWQALVVSARTPEALEAATDRLAAHLRAHPEQALADVAWTLASGRREMEHRRAVVCRTGGEAAERLEARGPAVATGAAGDEPRPVAFLFPGVGDHYAGMGRGLYETEPVFREEVDRCAALLRPHLGLDLREVLYPPGDGDADGEEGGRRLDLRALLRRGPAREASPLDRTELAHPALFVVEYALARLWMSRGVRPAALLGHSLGELVAAALAGVFALEDALRLVAERARMIQALPEGAMLGVSLSADDVRPLLTGDLSLATDNAPGACVASGPEDAVAALEATLLARGAACLRLHASHAFHGTMMEPVVERFAERVARVERRAPEIPFLSNVTGTWITPDEAADPAYWGRHLRQTVRFREAAGELVRRRFALLEVGPGQTLAGFVRQQEAGDGEAPVAASSLRNVHERHPDGAYLLEAAARLWTAGAAVDWTRLHAGEHRRRVPLPTYPFQRRRHWVEPRGIARTDSLGGRGTGAGTAGGDPLLYLPAWRQAAIPPVAGGLAEAGPWLVLADDAGAGHAAALRLRAAGAEVTVAVAADRFDTPAEGDVRLRPGDEADYAALAAKLARAGRLPARVLHLWSIGGTGDAALQRGWGSVLRLVRALAEAGNAPVRLLAAAAGAADLADEGALDPAAAALEAACRVAAQEHPGWSAVLADVAPPRDAAQADALAARLLAEALRPVAEPVVALRGRGRWVRAFERAPLAPGAPVAVRPGGVWLLAGTAGGSAPVLAAHLARAHGARVVVAEWGGAGGWEPGDPGVAVLRFGAEAPAAKIVRRARGVFGAIGAVVHTPRFGAAAVPARLDALDVDAAAESAARLCAELAELDAALEGSAAGPRVVQVSLAGVLGGIGMAGPSAANLACAAAAQSRGWMAVAWDRWAEAGEEGIAPAQAMAALDRALALGAPHVLASAEPLQARMERAPAPPAAGAAPVEAAEAGYVAPSSDAEQVVAEIWREMLGVEKPGVHDNFFLLGGHSLLGTQVVTRVREAFRVDLPVQAIFQHPTIAEMALAVEELLIAQILEDEEAMGLV